TRLTCRETSAAKASSELRRAYSRTSAMSSFVIPPVYGHRREKGNKLFRRIPFEFQWQGHFALTPSAGEFAVFQLARKNPAEQFPFQTDVGIGNLRRRCRDVGGSLVGTVHRRRIRSIRHERD